MSIKVTDKEITQFDPMIHMIIQKEILPYWTSGKGNAAYSNKNMTIGRLGMDIEDLVQFGRMVVFRQIKWYKKNKRKKDAAKLSTLMYKYLKNKFISLSSAHTWLKRGGPIMKIDPSRKNIEQFVNNFDENAPVKENREKLVAAILHSKTARYVASKQKDNAKILKFANKILLNLHKTWTVSIQDATSQKTIHPNIRSNPETQLLVKEEIQKRLKEYCKKNNLDSITIREYLSSNNKIITPNYLAANKTYLVMQLANKMGITSQRQLAKLMGVGASTLSNILRGRSRGTVQFRKQIKNLFGLSISELKQIVSIKTSK